MCLLLLWFSQCCFGYSSLFSVYSIFVPLFCEKQSFARCKEVLVNEAHYAVYSKTYLERHSNKPINTDYPLMKVKRIAECSKGSILQYFRPSLSYHLSVLSLFCLFMSGRLRQVLLYSQAENTVRHRTDIESI